MKISCIQARQRLSGSGDYLRRLLADDRRKKNSGLSRSDLAVSSDSDDGYQHVQDSDDEDVEERYEGGMGRDHLRGMVGDGWWREPSAG